MKKKLKGLGLTKKELIDRIESVDSSVAFRPTIKKKKLEQIYRDL